MTPAEFRTHRESLGLSADWLADRLEVHVNMVYRYESTERTLDVPARVEAELLDLLNDFRAATERLALEHENDPTLEVLPRYVEAIDFWAAVPELAGWPVMAQALLLAEVMRQHDTNLRVEYVASGETLAVSA